MYTLQYRQWLKGKSPNAHTQDNARNETCDVHEELDDAIHSIKSVRTQYHDYLDGDDSGRDELEIAETILSNMARDIKSYNPQIQSIAQEIAIADKSAELLDDAKQRLTSLMKDEQRMDDEAPSSATCTSRHVNDYSKAIAKVNDASTKLDEFIREIVQDML